MSTCINGKSVWLTGEQIRNLRDNGAVSAVRGVSTSAPYAGDTTSVYFFNAEGVEVAHLTMLSNAPVFYTRKWGSASGYEPLPNFACLLRFADDLTGSIKYNLIMVV